MSRYSRAAAFGLMIALVVVLASGAGAMAADDDKEIKKAQADILDLAKKIADGKDVTKETEAIRKKYEDLNTVMHAYKPSPKGGIGTGLEPKVGDGIEVKLNNLGKRALPAATLTKEKDALLKLAYVNIAIGEITMHYAPAKPKAGKGAKEWKQHTADMVKASKELVKAVKAGSAAEVKTASINVNAACQNCHSDFRD